MQRSFSVFEDRHSSDLADKTSVIIETLLLNSTVKFEIIEILTDHGFHQMPDDHVSASYGKNFIMGSHAFCNDIMQHNVEQAGKRQKQNTSIIVIDITPSTNDTRARELEKGEVTIAIRADEMYLSRTLHRPKIPNGLADCYILPDKLSQLIWRVKKKLGLFSKADFSIVHNQLDELIDPAEPFMKCKRVIIGSDMLVSNRQKSALLLAGYQLTTSGKPVDSHHKACEAMNAENDAKRRLLYDALTPLSEESKAS